MKIIKIGMFWLVIASATVLQGAATRSVIDFSQAAKSAQQAELQKSKQKFSIADRLEQWAVDLKNVRPTADTIWEEREFIEPAKQFFIAAATRLIFDIAKSAARGSFSQGSVDASFICVLLLKSIVQGGLVGAFIGAAGSWGTLPQTATSVLVEHSIFAQLFLEAFDGIGGELVRGDSIDEATFLCAMTLVFPALIIGLQSAVVYAGRQDVLTEKMLVEAALRGMRSHENVCSGK